MMIFHNYNYDIPYRSAKVESLFVLSSRVAALHVSTNLRVAQELPPELKNVLVELLGRRDLLSNPVLRSLVHKNLPAVNLSGVIAKDSTVDILQTATKLETLQIPRNEISSINLVGLYPYLPCLNKLDMSSCSQVNDAVLISMTDSCPLLGKIHLGKCPNFTNKGFQYLASKLKKVVVLDISHTKVTDESLKALSEGPSSPNLKELHINGCQELSSKCGPFLKDFPSISELSFFDCPRLSSSEWFESFSNNGKKPLKNISYTIE